MQRWTASLEKTGVSENGGYKPKLRSEDETEALEITIAKLTWSKGGFPLGMLMLCVSQAIRERDRSFGDHSRETHLEQRRLPTGYVDALRQPRHQRVLELLHLLHPQSTCPRFGHSRFFFSMLPSRTFTTRIIIICIWGIVRSDSIWTATRALNEGVKMDARNLPSPVEA
eukprot:1355387-Amphidinium_carterae.1